MERGGRESDPPKNKKLISRWKFTFEKLHLLFSEMVKMVTELVVGQGSPGSLIGGGTYAGGCWYYV